ncbi:expressed unknown protein [Ectocarpus siliculosus]|uniref:Uncharacterized protein n=1 Tax=Ectocarpus siliculosus TaxID=2880 RepID=D7G6M2_ECTSI|nr:expressed unknown protein [Ectocarpus siliculosus]|eukprot:CBJ33961.1 expressed unknown protein [Ectocarpus siliculosus]
MASSLAVPTPSPFRESASGNPNARREAEWDSVGIVDAGVLDLVAEEQLRQEYGHRRRPLVLRVGQGGGTRAAAPEAGGERGRQGCRRERWRSSPF